MSTFSITPSSRVEIVETTTATKLTKAEFVTPALLNATHEFLNHVAYSETMDLPALDAFYAICMHRLQEKNIDLLSQNNEVCRLARRFFKSLIQTESSKLNLQQIEKIKIARNEFFKRLIRETGKSLANSQPLLTQIQFEAKVLELKTIFKSISKEAVSSELKAGIQEKISPITTRFIDMDPQQGSSIFKLPSHLFAHILSFITHPADVIRCEKTCKRMWNFSYFNPHSSHWQLISKQRFPKISPICSIPIGMQISLLMMTIKKEKDTTLQETQHAVQNMRNRANVLRTLAMTRGLTDKEKDELRNLVGPDYDGTPESVHPTSLIEKTIKLASQNIHWIEIRYSRQKKFNEVFESMLDPFFQKISVR